ncbi:hypothetical protein DPMN_038608 [Dreissena polymorpha]|uniref:Uncharacterized protein n=1 Tax=Dreissena polymorpha TaxID=45954 RepID=A0A9D4MDF8_DREPO|nr:hypothetical protein DPMN_038608 [Dreissena polymorpha]
MRRHVLWRLIRIQTVCKGLQNSVPALKELKIYPVFDDITRHSKHSHITPQSPSPVITSYEKPTLSFEAMLLGDYPHVTIEDLIRAPFESTSAPGPELVKEENTRVLENGSALSGYLVDNDRENTITSLEPIASVVDQSPAAVDQKGTNCDNIIEKASSG